MNDLSPALRGVLLATLTLLSLAMLLGFWRLVRGPSAPDRVVALDLIAGVTVGMIAVYTALTGERHLLRVAMGLALISFLGTVGVARYLVKKEPR
ncbi:monovalent cation/H+ antiporter complex subunit F [Myxococcus sp. RHSTA-1-4]|uniref:monovalent cation/H+ antiporter complex subunit F n=1 Tax=Myxococcus sp. RHSTA-1-4 TaxID=2874601 RepID=UPI001CBAA45D|nr:cation:proton antiporter [Myxococcus sp. RHSTA-1-4]MBZ4420002.1 cation:proton antiporter [Myxococcus sp. RHSTA-1-4]